MKLFLAAVFVVMFILGAAYVIGVFDVKATVTIDKENVVELTNETINKTRESTGRVFEALKKKVKESNSYKE